MSRDNEEDDLPVEEIERRQDVRAISPGVRIVLRAPRTAAFEAVEASRRSFFVRVDTPEAFGIGEVFEATIFVGGVPVNCKLEVIRCERDPRSGVALRMAYIDTANEKVLKDLLGPLAEGG